MDRFLRLFGVCVIWVVAFASQSVVAAAISGQGTWESTLLGRDLDGNTSTYEAYYDTVLGITWLADANAPGAAMTWNQANNWASGLNVNGVTGWRLPKSEPINGSSYNGHFTTNATSDVGYAGSSGWVDDSGAPVSEMGHLYYVTLGNLGLCPPDGGDGDPATCDGYPQQNFGLKNTGPFSNLQSSDYWSGSDSGGEYAWMLNFYNGYRVGLNKGDEKYVWAVHDGDISPAPLPAAVWLFGSGLMGLWGFVAFRRQQRP